MRMPTTVHTLSAKDFCHGVGNQYDGPTCLLGHLGRQFGGGVRWANAINVAPAEAVEALYKVVADAKLMEPPALYRRHSSFVYTLNDDPRRVGKAKWLKDAALDNPRNMENEMRAQIWNRFIKELGYTEDA